MSIQDRLDQAIRGGGGYWVPLAGLARVLEELGELAAATSIEERRREASDCVVATLLLANQYCVRLPSVDLAEPGAGEHQALVAAGHLARLINRFEGSKPPKPMEAAVPSFPQVIASIIGGLAEASSLTAKALLERAAQTVEANVVRDAGRFAARIDAITADSRLAYCEDVLGTSSSPLDGLWGFTGALQEIERFLRVDIVHPLTALVSGPHGLNDPAGEAVLLQFRDHCGSASVGEVLGKRGRYVVLQGRRYSETKA